MEEIINTEFQDLDFIFRLFEDAIKFQQKKNYPVWRGYDRQLITEEIASKNQFKIVMNGEIAYVFSICYSDKIIWREKDNDLSVYLHRMAVNQKFKGQRLFGKVLEFTKQCCADKSKKFIRMDTWANNPHLINYYTGFGFKIVEYYKTPDSEELPLPQRNNEVVLLEIDLKNFDS